MENVFLMMKTTSGEGARTHLSAFDSFWAANRAMFDDWTLEYMEYIETKVMDDDDDEWDPRKHDPDGFWENQVRPFENDWKSKLRFPDGREIEWEIRKAKLEGLSGPWDARPGYCPPNEDEQS